MNGLSASCHKIGIHLELMSVTGKYRRIFLFLIEISFSFKNLGLYRFCACKSARVPGLNFTGKERFILKRIECIKRS